MKNSQKNLKKNNNNDYSTTPNYKKDTAEVISLDFNLTDYNNNKSEIDSSINNLKINNLKLKNSENSENRKFKVNEALSGNVDNKYNEIYGNEEPSKNDQKKPERNFKNQIKDLNFSHVFLRDKRSNLKSNKSLEELYPFEYETAMSKKPKKNTEKNINNNNKGDEQEIKDEQGIEMENLILKKLKDDKEKNNSNNKHLIENYNTTENICYENNRHVIENINRVNTSESKKINLNKANNLNYSNTQGNKDFTDKASLKSFKKTLKQSEDCNAEKVNYQGLNNHDLNNDKDINQEIFKNSSSQKNLINKKTKEHEKIKKQNTDKSGIFVSASNINNNQNIALESQLFLNINNNRRNFKSRTKYDEIKLTSNEVFIGKIDKIFELLEKSEIEKNPFSFQMLILFLINFVNIMNFWAFYYIISDVKNNHYCWDRNSASISVCYPNIFCDLLKSGPPNLAYITDPNISDENEIIEALNLNKYFRSIFL